MARTPRGVGGKATGKISRVRKSRGQGRPLAQMDGYKNALEKAADEILRKDAAEKRRRR
jgi:hypothetical protein